MLAAALGLVVVGSVRAGESSPFSGVSINQALNDAEAVASRLPGANVVRVEGVSMTPYFGDGALLVVKPIAFDRVHQGMVVVYRNNFGETVAHRVIAPAGQGGWRVQGYNNDRADSTVVTSSNLQGVVYATFYSRGLPAASEAALTAQLAAVPVALAAPAR